MNTFGSRLKEIRIILGLSQKDFALFFETSAAYISLVEKDKSKLSLENVIKLLLKYNINLNWLTSGIGDMFISTCENTLESRNNEALTQNIDTFHKRLQKLMQENDLNTWDLAKKTGIRESHISSLIIADKRPSLDDLHALKTHFDVSLDWLLYGETPNQTGQKESSTQTPEPALSAAEIEFIRNLMKKSSS